MNITHQAYPKNIFYIFLFLINITTAVIGSDINKDNNNNSFVIPSSLTFEKFGRKFNIAYFKKNDTKYVVKSHESLDMLVAELFGNHIAEEMQISSNRVDILPVNTEIKTRNKAFSTIRPFLKEMQKRALKSNGRCESTLTIHTYIEGKTLKKDNPLNIDIQGLHDPKHLRSIASHKDLSDLESLDLITANNDRHLGNVIRLHHQKGYCGIDMDHCHGYALQKLTEGFGHNLKDLNTITEKDKELLDDFFKDAGQAYKTNHYLKTVDSNTLASDKKKAFINIKDKLTMRPSAEKQCELWMKTCAEVNWQLNEAQEYVFTRMITANDVHVSNVIKELDRLTQ